MGQSRTTGGSDIPQTTFHFKARDWPGVVNNDYQVPSSRPQPFLSQKHDKKLTATAFTASLRKAVIFARDNYPAW